MLSANVNCPALGNSGTAIFSGRSGALVKAISAEQRTQILIADVPINLPRNPVDSTGENGLPAKSIAKSERSVNVPDIKFKGEDLSGFVFQFLKSSISSTDEITVEYGLGAKYCQLRYVLLDLGKKSDDVNIFSRLPNELLRLNVLLFLYSLHITTPSCIITALESIMVLLMLKQVNKFVA